MKIKLHPRFKKSYKVRISTNKKLVIQVEARMNLFKTDPNNPILKNHQLVGAKRKLCSFSISGDMRIIYMAVDRDEVIFLDIGSHNQVY